MPENFEHLNNRNDNQPEDEGVEKLEGMDFDKRAIEVLYTLRDLRWAFSGEKLVQKGEISHKPYDAESEWIESYKRIHNSVTAEEWEELKKIREAISTEVNNNWVIDSDHHLNSFNTIIKNSLEDTSWDRNTDKFKKNYLFRREKVEKLFDECQFWPELNRGYEILSPFLSKKRLFYEEEK